MLYVILSFSVLLLSCEREVLQQSSKVIISLPGGDNSLQNILNPFSSVSTNSDGGGDDNDEFNSFILPAFGSNLAFPVNCYLVAIGSRNGESLFTRNYCGKRSTVTGKTDRNFEFGPYVGLFSNTANVELEVAPGEKRIIYVFGIHALNPAACVSLSAGQGQNPSSSNFSKPYLVGTSATFTVAGGQTSVIPINLNQPVAVDSIDDCVIQELNDEIENPATRIAMERESFPQNIISIKKAGEALVHRCDYIDFVPKNGYETARVDEPKQIRFKVNATTYTTYPSNAACVASASGVPDFPIDSTAKKFRRWIGFSDTPTGINTFTAESIDGSLLPENRVFDLKPGRIGTTSPVLFDGTNYLRAAFDFVIPNKVITGQCYQFFITRKTLEDEILTHASQATPVVLSVTNPANVQFFVNTNCTGGILPSPATIGAGNHYAWHSFAATGDFEMSAIAGAGGFFVPVESSAVYKIFTSSDTINLTPASVEIVAPAVVRKRSTFFCSPILFRFKNSEKAVVKSPTIGSIQLLFNQSEGDISSTRFYDDDTCSTPQITNVNPIVSLTSGLEFRKIYMKNAGDAVLGNKTIRFKVFDGVKTYYQKYQVEVIDPNI